MTNEQTISTHQEQLTDIQTQLDTLDAEFLTLLKARKDREDGTPILVQIGAMIQRSMTLFAGKEGTLKTAAAVSQIGTAAQKQLRLGYDLIELATLEKKLRAALHQVKETRLDVNDEYQAGHAQISEFRRQWYDKDEAARAELDKYEDELYNNIVPTLTQVKRNDELEAQAKAIDIAMNG